MHKSKGSHTENIQLFFTINDTALFGSDLMTLKLSDKQTIYQLADS